MAYNNNKDYRKEAFKKTQSHWQMDASHSVFPKAKKSNQLDNFIAKPVKEWPHTHVEVNDCDY